MPFPGMTPQARAAPLQSFAKQFGGEWSSPQQHGALSFMNPMVPRGTSNQSPNYDPMQLFQWLQKMMQGMRQG